MIDELVIDIFDFIFSSNIEIKNGEGDKDTLCKILDEKIAERYEIYDFWNEYRYYFNDFLIDATSLGGTLYIYKYFPKFKIETLREYLEYKKRQLEITIYKNGLFEEEEFEKITREICNEGKKEILDYCERLGIIKYNGMVFLNADNNVASEIAYENIKANYEDANVKKNDILKTSFLIEYKKIQRIEDSKNAEIWLVEDNQRNQYIAKILNKNISKEKLIRYRNEINFCKIHHNKHLIEVIDNGLTSINNQDYMFYIMKKYDMNFRKLMNEGIDDSKKLYYFNQILDGIKFIHSKESFHRDIKPENILYDSSNDILVIADLGIAHFNEDELIEDPKTKLASKMANFQYSAPEQRVKGGNVDYRCDIYSLGVLLNELFTNQILQGSNYEKISDVNKDFSFMDSIVEKMTEQNPQKRFSTIEEVQYAISSGIEIFNRNEAIQKLKEIKNENEYGNDILINDPIRIVNIKISNDYKLTIFLNHKTNELWRNTLMNVNKIAVYGYGPERFQFIQDEAIVLLDSYNIDKAPDIIECFKKWIDSTNVIYPQRRKEEQNRVEQLNRQKIEKEIKEYERLNEIRKKINF